MAESNGEVSSAAEGSVSGAPRQPRQPRDLQGLMRFALEAVARENEDVEERPVVDSIDDDRRNFLEEAIKSLTVDVTKVLQDSINVLSDKEYISGIRIQKDVPIKVFVAFEDIELYTSVIETAIGFYKLGGFSIFPVCLSCENSVVRNYACRLLGSLCENNPFCQNKILESGYLQTLISMFNQEQDDDLLQSAMYSISCMIRHNETCTNEFFKEGGYAILRKALRSSVTSLQVKAAFLITSVFPENRHMSDRLLSEGVIEALLKALPPKRDQRCEQVLCALTTLLANDEPAILAECRNPKYKLREFVNEYLRDEEISCPDTDYVEEKQYCESILATVFENASSSSSISVRASDSDSSIDR